MAEYKIQQRQNTGLFVVLEKAKKAWRMIGAFSTMEAAEGLMRNRIKFEEQHAKGSDHE